MFRAAPTFGSPLMDELIVSSYVLVLMQGTECSPAQLEDATCTISMNALIPPAAFCPEKVRLSLMLQSASTIDRQ